MKKIVRLCAYTRVDFSAVIDIPDDTSELDECNIAELFYNTIEGGEYCDDNEYWEKGPISIESVAGSEKPEYRVERDPSNKSFAIWKEVSNE